MSITLGVDRAHNAQNQKMRKALLMVKCLFPCQRFSVLSLVVFWFVPTFSTAVVRPTNNSMQTAPVHQPVLPDEEDPHRSYVPPALNFF